MSAALKLFWWAAKPNFGDALSPLVTAYAAGRAVGHAPPQRAELFAVGSVLDIVQRAIKDTTRARWRPWIWGTGLLRPLEAGFAKRLHVAMLRGPITAAILGLKSERYGDPGLLAAEALGPPPERDDKVGLILHHAKTGHPAITTLLADEPSVVAIDVRAPAETVAHQIAACRHVISSSLHGLVVADSYGVPNTWLAPINHPRLKYYDYAAGIERVLPLPLAHDDIKAALPRLAEGPLPYGDGIARAKSDLMEHFPAQLRADR